MPRGQIQRYGGANPKTALATATLVASMWGIAEKTAFGC